MVPIQFGIPGGPELLLLLLLFVVVVPFALAYWVYTDAAGRDEDNAAFWALAVGALGYLTFFGGFLAAAVYVWQRDDPAAA